MRLAAIGISLYFLGLQACSRPVQEIDKLQQLVDSLYLAHPESRGLLVHVESPRNQLNWGGFKSHDSSKLTATSPLLIASITKLFTSAATMAWLESKDLSIHTPIHDFLSSERDSQMRAAGYNTALITFGHLLSCTAGIADYVETSRFQERTVKEPGYHWTRNEQIDLAFSTQKLGEPGDLYAHGDINFLLLGELLEQQCGKPFYTAIRDLLQLDKHGLDNVYFNQLERRENQEQLVQQFASSYHADSYSQDASFDLYGGGGIRCNLEDLAHFTRLVYQGKLFKNAQTLTLYTSDVYLNSGEVSPYGYGQMRWFSEQDSAYGHGGFWGTMVQYFPADSTTIAVSVLDRDAWKLNLELIEHIRKAY
ncbi:MAG: class A beta-lactamase-related serine hydrolase [Bacteroidetes bacterium]|nr:MAG: class A beta-lactamase-related serine hydrolase [Bacteroidota bacterium]